MLIVVATGAILLGSFLLLGFTFTDELRKRERLKAELEERIRARSVELLHSCALAAQEMGGTLVARPQGLGHGACFTLEVPVERSSG